MIGPFHTAEAALAGAAHAQADLAVVDINLSGHHEGLGVARTLQQRHGLASVFATGQADIARANRDAATGVLAKPHTDDIEANALGWAVRSLALHRVRE